MTSLKDLTAEIWGLDNGIAPGSESGLWGDYLERMRVVTGCCESSPDNIPAHLEVTDDEADWWRKAYALAKQNPTWDQQEIFEAV